MLMYRFGVPINVAQKAIEKRARQESQKMHSKNLNRQADFAKFIDMPYLGLHTPADLIGQAIVQERMDALTKDKPFTTLQDVVDVLNEFPEVRGALQDPAIRVGEPAATRERCACSLPASPAAEPRCTTPSSTTASAR